MSAMHRCLSLICVGCVSAADHFIAADGNDARDGLTPATAWRTLARASRAYQPGDRVLLRCGDAWQDESLVLRGRGTPTAPITVASYGDGDRPLIRWTARLPAADDQMRERIAVQLAGMTDVVVRGLDIRGASTGIHWLPPAGTGDGIAGVPTGLSGVRIEDNVLADISAPQRVLLPPDAAVEFRDPGWIEGGPANDPATRYIGAGIRIALGGGAPLQRRIAAAPGDFPLLSGVVIANNIGFRNAMTISCAVGQQGEFFSGRGAEIRGNTVAFGDFNQVNLSGWRDGRITGNVTVYNGVHRYFRSGLTSVITGFNRGTLIDGNEFAWQTEVESEGHPAKDGCGFDWENPSWDERFTGNFVHDCFGEGVLVMSDKPQHAPLRFGTLRLDGNLYAGNGRYSPKHRQDVTIAAASATVALLDNRHYIRDGIAPWVQRRRETRLSESGNRVVMGPAITATHPAFCSQPRVSAIAARPGERTYTFTCATPGAVLRHTRDGSLPTAESPVLRGPVTLRRSGALNVVAFQDGLERSAVSSHIVDLRDREGAAPAYPATPNHFSISAWVRPQPGSVLKPNLPQDHRGRIDEPLPLLLDGQPSATGAVLALAVAGNGIGVMERGHEHLPLLLKDHLGAVSGWTHVVVTVANRTPTLWVDGEFRRVGTPTRRDLLPPTRATHSDVVNYQVFDRVLTPAEIQRLASDRPTAIR